MGLRCTTATSAPCGPRHGGRIIGGMSLATAALLASAACSGDVYSDAPSSVETSGIRLTTEARMARAGMPLDERRALRDSMVRRANEGPEEGLAKRRSVDLYAEIRRVLGPDAPLRT